MQFVEEEFTLRTKDAHKEQCDMMSDDVSQAERQYYSKVYGINRSSAISHLDHFDITKQLPQDVMHVLLEGVVPLNSPCGGAPTAGGRRSAPTPPSP